MILSGSSHGSTTSARFAKHRKVARVVMFCGLETNWNHGRVFHRLHQLIAIWFTHILDTIWVGDHYCRSCRCLDWQSWPAGQRGSSESPFGNSRRLVTNCDVNNDSRKAHGIVVRGKDWDSVWRYLYTHPVDQTGVRFRLIRVQNESTC